MEQDRSGSARRVWKVFNATTSTSLHLGGHNNLQPSLLQGLLAPLDNVRALRVDLEMYDSLHSDFTDAHRQAPTDD